MTDPLLLAVCVALLLLGIHIILANLRSSPTPAVGRPRATQDTPPSVPAAQTKVSQLKARRARSHRLTPVYRGSVTARRRSRRVLPLHCGIAHATELGHDVQRGRGKVHRHEAELVALNPDGFVHRAIDGWVQEDPFAASGKGVFGAHLTAEVGVDLVEITVPQGMVLPLRRNED